MIKIYVKLIKEEKMTLQDVPVKWRAAVREALKQS